MSAYLLAIDQGTTSSRAAVFNQNGQCLQQHQVEFTQYFPQLGWVEHDPEEIWLTVLECCQQAVLRSHLQFKDIAAIGITNQRETTLLWDKKTGKPIYRAIVWQDRRTSSLCQQLKQQGHEPIVQAKTGLLLDPYFSASKIAWLLDHVDGARVKAKRGELAFGTIDCFLLWRLTGGKVHATDASNASRTLLFNIHEQQWDDTLLTMFNIPASILPTVHDNCAEFGKLMHELFAVSTPILAMAGDQQAALFGQACFEQGMSKSTYGTGCFVMLNTGEQVISSQNRLLATIAYQLHGKATYALEGSIFSAGTTIQWLRDKLGIIQHAAQTEKLADDVNDNGGVYLVPAFTGLGAPYWDADARGAILGLTRDSNAAHIVRAALEAVAYQTQDLLLAMSNDGAQHITELRVDGGMTSNNWLMQFMADLCGIPITRPQITETTVLGIAYLAGLSCGLYSSLGEIQQLWQAERQFQPTLDENQRTALYNGWQQAVAKILYAQPKKEN